MSENPSANLVTWRDFYHFGGLHGLIVQGCPADIIGAIRSEDRQKLGITKEEDLAAQDAVDHPEYVKKALVIKLPHNRWRSATDYLLFSMRQFFVFLDDGRAVSHLFCEAEYDFKKHFGRKIDLVDDFYFIIPANLTKEAFDLFCSLV